MRKILFRGKRLDGEWIEGALLTLNGRVYINNCPETHATLSITTCVIRGFVEVIPETVGQYTGLTDKNGKEIFEGDICKSIYGISRVIWSDGRSAFMMRFCDYPHEIIGFEEIQDSIEIIGNIHDTPELLEAEG